MRNMGTLLGGDVPVFDITMLGSTGTGKTTLLASVYEQFDKVIGTTDLAVAPDYVTDVKLREYIAHLRDLPRTVQVAGGIPGTGNIREYSLGVSRRGRQQLFMLRFTDYPGKYLLTPDGAYGEDLVQRALIQADVILVAIDTPALMEEHGRYHSIVNAPVVVTDQLKRLFAEDTVRLVILVPLKCERYLSTVEGARQLTARICEQYEPLLAHIRRRDVRPRVSCVLTPVQTIGSVVFSNIVEEPEGYPVFYYHRRHPEAIYQPVDTDQPLRYALRFIVNRYRVSERPFQRGLWQAMFGTDSALAAAVDQFSAGCKQDGSFRVLQSALEDHQS
jgi:hypothetical protein